MIQHYVKHVTQDPVSLGMTQKSQCQSHLSYHGVFIQSQYIF